MYRKIRQLKLFVDILKTKGIFLSVRSVINCTILTLHLSNITEIGYIKLAKIITFISFFHF